MKLSMIFILLLFSCNAAKKSNRLAAAKIVMTNQQQTDSIVSMSNQMKSMQAREAFLSASDFYYNPVTKIVTLKKNLRIDSIYTKDTLWIGIDRNRNDTLMTDPQP